MSTDRTDLYVDRALCKHLSTMTPTMNIVWENINYSPVIGTPYLEAWLLPVPTTSLTLGPDSWIEFSGIYQVTCVYPSGKGRGEAKTKAAAVRNHFKRGTVCTYNNITVKIKQSYPASGYFNEDGSWYRVPVSVIYQCFDN